MSVGSSLAGIRPVMLPSSPAVRLVGVGAAADRHKWSDVSDKNVVLDLLNKDVRPRLRLDRMISSNNLIDGSSARVDSRSCMNSLNIWVCRMTFM